MDQEDQKREPRPQSAEPDSALPRVAGPAFSLRRRYAQVVGLALLTAGLIAAVMLYLRVPTPCCDAQDLAKSSAGKRELFHGWSKPDVALMLSGQMHGYLQPCGCSEPQFGGMARRLNFLQVLRERGWPVVCLDLGDLAQKSGPQAMLKYTTAMQALQLMGYTAIAVGKNEMDMPLIDALSNYTLNNPFPRVLAANLFDPESQTFQGMVRGWALGGKEGAPKVGVTALIGPSVAGQVKDTSIKFAANNSAALKKAAAALQAQKADVTVLLYQGTVKEAKSCAEYWAKAQKADPTIPRLHVIQCLSEEEEPPSVPERAGNSLIVTVGHKGRYVGVVGVFRTGQASQPFDLRYQLVCIGPEYKTPMGKEAANPIMALMEDYTRELKDRNYLARFPRTAHPMQIQYPNAKYVGSERCGDCHEHAFKVWHTNEKKPLLAHAKAYQALEKAERPSLRQFDGECVVCHVVGFNHPSGFNDPANSAKMNDFLKHVGCESCHGPGSVHTNSPNNAALYPLLNPWKALPGAPAAAEKARLLRIDLFCQKCHDVDNDTHWNFDQRWPEIIHMTPRKAAPKADSK
jgi:Cytochrome c554 and c-prime